MHHHTELPFVDEFRRISPLHYLKTDDRTLFFFGACWKRGPPSLHYYCAVLLHSRIVLPPAGHSSNHEYHCCQLTWQSSCVSIFYHTFNIFIWLSLECIVISLIRDDSVTTQNVWFFRRDLKILECKNFLWVRRRPDCSPAASFTNCVMTLRLLKVHPQTCLSIPITQKMHKFWVVKLLSQISCM